MPLTAPQHELLRKTLSMGPSSLKASQRASLRKAIATAVSRSLGPRVKTRAVATVKTKMREATSRLTRIVKRERLIARRGGALATKLSHTLSNQRVAFGNSRPSVSSRAAKPSNLFTLSPPKNAAHARKLSRRLATDAVSALTAKRSSKSLGKKEPNVQKERQSRRSLPANAPRTAHALVTKANAEARLFEERARLLREKTLTADQKLRLLSEMEESVRRQETTWKRLGRLLTDPRFWGLALSAGVGVSALYQGPVVLGELTRLVTSVGNAAKDAGAAAALAADSTTALAGTVGCAAASAVAGVGLLATGIGVLAAVPVFGACLLSGFFRR